MFLSRQHDYDKDELGSEKHFDEEALGNIGASTQRGVYTHGPGKQRQHNTSRSDAAEKLGDHGDKAADGGKTANQQ